MTLFHKEIENGYFDVMGNKLSTTELEAYLDEALPAEAMSRIEDQLRGDQALLAALAALNARRDAGLHSLGSVWRSGRLSCPSRVQLGSYLLGVLPDEPTQYITFHIQTVGCRYCAANLADMKAQQTEAAPETEKRRHRYFQSSAGYLRKT